MALHFSNKEFDTRISRTIEQMEKRNLDGLLMFRQESMYYLSGYDSFGYVFFQCLYLGADGRLMLLTRSPDLRQARHTSIIEDIRIWVDSADSDPADQLREILHEFECKGKRLGVEYDAYGLTARNGRMLDAALQDFCTLEDASDLVNKLRVVKSEAEMVYVRKAAELADRAYDEAYRTAAAGADEGDILAAMQGIIFSGGGDYPGNEFIIGSARDALLCRYKSGRRKLDSRDQLTLEWAAAYRHYHAAMMRTIPIGEATPRHREMHQVCLNAMQACKEALQPGRPIGEVFDAYAKTCDEAGMREHRLNATGYGMGTTFAPNWMDWPMFYHANPVIAEPNMVFFLHMILMDSETDHAMCFGHSVVVTASGCDSLSDRSMDLIVK
ncbi:MAG: aminopeptidase P family protein [Deltaproteobacteria bacterium]|jgi:Xaa-Pro dipeptidase|nr:aminopeptidase P family protein [Deltaproteobacteria bacterium]